MVRDILDLRETYPQLIRSFIAFSFSDITACYISILATILHLDGHVVNTSPEFSRFRVFVFGSTKIELVEGIGFKLVSD